MRSEYKRLVTQASEEMLARWILKNLDWSGGNDDANGAFLASILLEHRRQIESARPEVGPSDIALSAIDSEPELPGDMPDDMWHEILRMVGELDRDGLIEAFRITVRQTKDGIRERYLAAYGTPMNLGEPK